MLILPGSSALSAFRIHRLLTQLKDIEPAISGIAGRFCHFVDSSAELDTVVADYGDARRTEIVGDRLTLTDHEQDKVRAALKGRRERERQSNMLAAG